MKARTILRAIGFTIASSLGLLRHGGGWVKFLLALASSAIVGFFFGAIAGVTCLLTIFIVLGIKPFLFWLLISTVMDRNVGFTGGDDVPPV